MELLLIFGGLMLYFLPSLIAGAREHQSGGAIFVVNLFLGWTLIGWIVALAIACGAVHHSEGSGAAPGAPAPGAPGAVVTYEVDGAPRRFVVGPDGKTLSPLD
jgi:Superinfection immunity protein